MCEVTVVASTPVTTSITKISKFLSDVHENVHTLEEDHVPVVSGFQRNRHVGPSLGIVSGPFNLAVASLVVAVSRT